MKLWAILVVALAVVQASPIQEPSQEATTDAVIHPDDNLVLSDSTTPEVDGDSTTTTTTTESGRQARILTSDLQVPAEVVITSGVVGVEAEGDHQGRTIKVGSDGIPIVEGVRMPDDPNDKRIFRNARVINGELVPNESNDNQTGDLFIYQSAAAGRALNSPSSQDNAFKPSMPFPAFYYQDYYKNGNPDLPDNVGVESVTSSSQQATNAFPFATEKNANILQQGYKIHSTSSVNGRPVYYVSKEEATQLHDDRAPYDYEPQQTTTSAPVDTSANGRIQSYASQQQQVPQDDQESQYLKQYYDYQQQQQNYQQQNYQQPQQNYQQPQQNYQQTQQNYRQPQQNYQQNYQRPQYQQAYQQPAQEKYQTQQYYSQPAQQQYQEQYQYPLNGGIGPANPNDFIIKQQTYTAGGTTYQIPVPVYKDYNNPQYYGNNRPNANPIKQFSTKIKQGFQGGADKIHDFTSPVVDPLMEAGHKISYNLGLAQKFDKFSEKVADPVVAPLVVASAASLALGALGVGAALKSQNVSIGLGSPLAGLGDKAKEWSNNYKNKTLLRVGRSVENENGETNGDLISNLLSGFSQPQKHFLTSLQKVGFENWKETDCAKRVFCDVMSQEDDLTIGVMEKRMATFLTMMDTGMAESLQSMTQDMMDAIRHRNCEQFHCGAGPVGVSDNLKATQEEGPR